MSAWRPEALAMLYDLRDPLAWRKAHRHRNLWGKRLTNIHVLDEDHVVLVFRSGGERWRRWEKARLRRILTRDAEEAA